jgi:hypothetical protein
MRRYHLLPLVVTVLSILSAAIKSGDGYVSRNGDTWTLGTAKVERKITLSKGRFFAASIKDKVSGRDLVKAGGVSEELRLSVDGHDVSGTSGGW